MGWFEKVLECCKQERTAHRAYQQYTSRIDAIQTEIADLEATLAGARQVIDHHRSKRNGGQMSRYHLASGKTVSSKEKQDLQSRLEALREVLPEVQNGQTERKEVWVGCRRELHKVAVVPILESNLTDKQKEEVQEEVDRGDIFIHVDYTDEGKKEAHVYFGDPNTDRHGHGIIGYPLRLIYLRFRNDPRGVDNIRVA